MASTERSPRSRPRHLHRVLAVLVAVLVAALVAEGVLRLVGYEPTYYEALKSFHVRDPETGYRGKPGFVGRFSKPEFNVTIAHDEYGFRRQEHQNEGSPRRVFVLGDSFVWGWGVEQGECFTDVLSQARPDLDVRNLGLNGSGTVAQSRIFDLHVRDEILPGDVVLLVFCSNDFGDNVHGALVVQVDGVDVRVLGPRKHGGGGVRGFLRDHSRLFNLVDYTIGRLRARSRRDAAIGRAHLLSADSEEVVVATAMIRRLREQTEGRGGRFAVTRVPYPLEFGEASEGARDFTEAAGHFREAYGRMMASLGLSPIDLLPAMQARRVERPGIRLSYPRDLHWTPEGHAAVAEVLAGSIETARPR